MQPKAAARKDTDNSKSSGRYSTALTPGVANYCGQMKTSNFFDSSVSFVSSCSKI